MLAARTRRPTDTKLASICNSVLCLQSIVSFWGAGAPSRGPGARRRSARAGPRTGSRPPAAASPPRRPRPPPTCTARWPGPTRARCRLRSRCTAARARGRAVARERVAFPQWGRGRCRLRRRCAAARGVGALLKAPNMRPLLFADTACRRAPHTECPTLQSPDSRLTSRPSAPARPSGRPGRRLAAARQARRARAGARLRAAVVHRKRGDLPRVALHHLHKLHVVRLVVHPPRPRPRAAAHLRLAGLRAASAAVPAARRRACRAHAVAVPPATVSHSGARGVPPGGG